VPASSLEVWLVCGIPGAGKTRLGDYLQDRHSFFHVNMEDDAIHSRLWVGGYPQSASALLREIAATHQVRRLVVTWGFMPGRDERFVDELVRDGARLVWLDGDREVALKWFNHRRTVCEKAFHIQMARIAAHDPVRRYQPPVIDPFDKKGQFRSLEVRARAVVAARQPG
jgi:hypothetical protein